MPEINYLEILRTSFTLVLLLGCSVVLLTFAAERWFFIKKASRGQEAFVNTLMKLIDSGKLEEALTLCGKTPTPLSIVAKAAITHRKKPKSQLEELLLAIRMEERQHLERHLGVLGTLGNIAPFVGLFGTVVGIIKAFQDLALSGSAGPSVVAAGIAEALVATAGGLAVAIPAVVLYNYFLKKVKNLTVAMETTQIKVLVGLEVA
ncbi:MAG: MotA/TolQ/ExbB proton channel family protein [Elusimicrobia bacterium]|nr:MotA/TolQ/ExbB proton channel family protein [Elusimicrobiota bacterium]